MQPSFVHYIPVVTTLLAVPFASAHMLTAALILYVIAASVAVMLAPIDMALVEPHRLSGRVLEWRSVTLDQRGTL